MKKYYVLNKPRGFLTALCDPRQKTVGELFKEPELSDLFPVGRLDKDTTGLLLLTNDGQFSEKVRNPMSKIKKTYLFVSKGPLDSERLRTLSVGARVFPDKSIVTAPAKVEIISESTIKCFKEYLDSRELLSAEKKPNTLATIGKVTVTEGKKHEVRRMIAYSGGRVVYLKRLSIGGLVLDDTLKEGELRPLTDDEVLKIFE